LIFQNKAKKAMELESLNVYKIAMEIGDSVWSIVLNWDSFSKFTLGKQWVNAADSIGQNISEGYGRFHFKDSKNFYYFSRGSLLETITILTKAFNRKLVTESEFTKLQSELTDLKIRLNNFINSIGSSKKS
jgi:four helix bundle protein